MVSAKMTNKRLVKVLMDKKHIDSITITKNAVVIQVDEHFTPLDGQILVRELGHESFKPVSKNGKNYIVFDRY